MIAQRNVEKLRAYLLTWDRELLRPELRPFDRVISVAFSSGLYAPEAVYEDAVLPDHAGEAYRGVEGFVRAGEGWIQPFEWLLVELDRIVDGREHVVSLHRVRMKTRHTEIEFESPLAYLFRFKEGKIVHHRAFVDHSEALEAAGLTA